MRDRKFAISKKALVESTQDKNIIPESFRLIGKSALYGKKGKIHTIILSSPLPAIELGYGRVEVRRNGKLLEPPKEFELNSWTLNHFNNVISTLGGINVADSVWGVGNLNGINTAGVLKYGAKNFSLSDLTDCGADGIWAPYGSQIKGIQLGTGTTAVDWDDDYSIETQIDHGTGAGQLCYASSPTPSVYAWDGASRTLTFYLDRYFDNFEAGVGSITATEMALVANLSVGGGTNYVLMARDIIPDGGKVIPYRAQAKIRYTFSMVFPSSGSPLRNYYNMAFSQQAALNANDDTFDDGYLNVKDTGNTVRYVARAITHAASSNLNTAGRGYAAAVSNNASGVVVGSDSATGVDFNDSQLNALISTATLGYSVTEAPAKSWASPVLTVTQARTFTNSSGGTVTARESGLIMGAFISVLRSFLTHHDTFPDVDIANGESLRVVYQLQTTLPI